MTSSHPMESGLAGAVRAGAAGLYSLEAACELVIGTGWLHRDDFARFVSTGTSLTDGVTELAHIDWQSVISNRDAGLLPCGSGENRILRMAASIAAGIPVDLNDVLCGLDQASITLVVRAAVTRTDSVPPISPDPDDMTCVTRKTGNRHTARHHQRETSALGSARQNRYTNPLHTASAERRHHFSHTWLDRGGAEADLMELNGWTSPQMLTRYGASARAARARRTYDRIMEEGP